MYSKKEINKAYKEGFTHGKNMCVSSYKKQIIKCYVRYTTDFKTTYCCELYQEVKPDKKCKKCSSSCKFYFIIDMLKSMHLHGLQEKSFKEGKQYKDNLIKKAIVKEKIKRKKKIIENQRFEAMFNILLDQQVFDYQEEV